MRHEHAARYDSGGVAVYRLRSLPVAVRLTPITLYRRAVRSFDVPAKQSKRATKSRPSQSPPLRTFKPVNYAFQQSAGDSTGPQVDVTERALGQLFSDDDVGNRTRPPGFRTRAISAIA